MSSSLAESHPPKEVNPWVVAFIVSIATFMEVLDTTIVNVALNHIAGNLSASQSESTWVITSYLLTNAIILPLSGWLAQVFGRKRYFMVSIALFTLASFCCGIANSLAALVFFRLLQGLSGGGLQPIQQAIILDSFPPHMRGSAFSITAITIIVAPVLGPTLGGYITDNYSWRWIFYINLPVGILAFWLTKKYISDPPHAVAQGLKGKKVDFIGLGLISIFFSSLQVMLDKGDTEDWFKSNFIIILAVICVFTLVGGIYWLSKQEEPFVEIKLLKIHSFGSSCFMIFIVGLVLYSSNIILPFLVQSQFGYDSKLAGLVLSPGALVVMLMMPIMGGFIVNRFYAKYLVAFGFCLLAFGMYSTMHFSPDTDKATFVFFRILQTIGLPFLFIPISSIAYMDIPKELNNKASALFALFRNIGGSIGVALTATSISQQTQVHQSYLNGDLAMGDIEYQQFLKQAIINFKSLGLSEYDASNRAMIYIYQQLIKQSSMLAYVDCFYYMTILSIALIPLALLLPKNQLYSKKEMHIDH